MRNFQSTALVLAGFLLAGCSMSFAQSADLIEKKDRVYGYVDMKSGQFHPGVAAAVNPEATINTKAYTGIIVTTISTYINPDTAKVLPTGYSILCDVTLTATVGGYPYTEIGAGVATVSGNYAKCTVYIPYEWTGYAGDPAADYTFSGTYKVTASYAPGGATQPLTDFNVYRQTTGALYNSTSVGVMPLPVSGATTTFSLNAMI